MNQSKIAWISLGAFGIGLLGILMAVSSGASDASREWNGLSMLPSLIAIALLAAGLYAVKNKVQTQAHPSLRVLRSLPISHNQRLLAVRFSGRVILVGQSPSDLRLLAQTSEPGEMAEFETETPAGEKKPFLKTLLEAIPYK